MEKIDWLRIDPYLISVEFDPEPEVFGENNWAITAAVDVGNRLLIPHATSIKNRLTRKIPATGSLNGDFFYLVCSSEFKAKPRTDYGVDLRYLHTAYVQEDFDKDDAIEHLRQLIDGMGEVSIDQFTDNIHKFLETDEWDYLNSRNDT